MSPSQKRILVIDDEPDVRTYLSTLLEDHGYLVETADNGESGWQMVLAQAPDLVTLDITMPEKSGVRFYRDMKESEQLKAVPIIIVTGVSTDFEQFISSRRKVPPPEGFLHKPVDQKQLLDKIAALLG
jgi:CheY-like chemotaxis protein